MNSPASASPLPSAGRSLRILYAEDMPQLRELMSVALAGEGHHIETVSDGAEALERLTKSHPAFDLLITDHHMPVMNGLELVRQLRLLPFPGKIIVFSSELSQAVHDKYRQLVVDLILPKLIFPLTLRRMLEQLFATGGPEAGRQRRDSRSPHACD
ncbi:MAG TPA: response regulator [Lacunisphaera sp.]|nr:response regulator [Lacunisphaera sp.]